MSKDVFIVEWDLSVTPTQRTQFSRKLNKLIKNACVAVERSTQSVLKTESQELATQVFKLATEYGTSHMYKAQQINGNAK